LSGKYDVYQEDEDWEVGVSNYVFFGSFFQKRKFLPPCLTEVSLLPVDFHRWRIAARRMQDEALQHRVPGGDFPVAVDHYVGKKNAGAERKPDRIARQIFLVRLAEFLSEMVDILVTMVLTPV
jgi:hypothetical protein